MNARELKPIRVQRKRTKGFKLPENTVCVTRGSKWGNPFKVDKYGLNESVDLFFRLFTVSRLDDLPAHAIQDAKDSKFFKSFIHSEHLSLEEMVDHGLRGKNLACFCSLDCKCHADILLDIANS